MLRDEFLPRQVSAGAHILDDAAGPLRSDRRPTDAPLSLPECSEGAVPMSLTPFCRRSLDLPAHGKPH